MVNKRKALGITEATLSGEFAQIEEVLVDDFEKEEASVWSNSYAALFINASCTSRV